MTDLRFITSTVVTTIITVIIDVSRPRGSITVVKFQYFKYESARERFQLTAISWLRFSSPFYDDLPHFFDRFGPNGLRMPVSF